MPETPQESVDLKAQYAARLAADLEQNTKDQERVTTEIAVLQEQLDTLRHDQALLVNLQKALGVTEKSTASPQADTGSRTTVPRQATAVRRPRAQKKTVTSNAKTAPQSGAPVPAPKGNKSRTLGDLVRGYLAQQSEPRSAAEVTAALSQDHPERKAKATVVRTTLEGLVAKGRVHRTRQGKSVFYSTSGAGATAGRAGAEEATDGATESAAAKSEA